MDNGTAIEIVSYLSAAFPNATLEQESFAVIVSAVTELPDGETGIEAAKRLARTTEEFPTIAEFRAQYRSIAETKRLDVPALAPGPRSKIPDWVQVWYWARNGRVPRELRSLPQQREGLADEPFLSDGEYLHLEDEWKAAGSPKFTDVTKVLQMT